MTLPLDGTALADAAVRRAMCGIDVSRPPSGEPCGPPPYADPYDHEMPRNQHAREGGSFPLPRETP